MKTSSAASRYECVIATGGYGKSRDAEAWLGKLVTFDKRRRVARPKREGGVPGQVVIFTGVRYERGPVGVPTDGDTPLKPKRKRG